MTPAAKKLAKVPEATMAFWGLKIVATTLGETAGDAVTMSMNLGYLAGSGIFVSLCAVALTLQIRSPRFRPWLYWLTIVTTTTLGTTVADFADRSLGIGYAGGSAILAGLLMASLAVWRRVLGSVAIESVDRPIAEAFYWTTLMFSQTLGTALGDWTSDTIGRGYANSGLLFGGLLALLALAYYVQPRFRTALFWAAFVLTRPLGAVLGDFLDKPLESGGLNFDRYAASAILASILLIGLCFPQRAASQAAFHKKP